MKRTARVIRVEQKTRTLGAVVHDRGLPTEQVDFKGEDLGWFIVIEGNLSIYWGPMRPEDVKAGDEVIITVEKSQ